MPWLYNYTRWEDNSYSPCSSQLQQQQVGRRVSTQHTCARIPVSRGTFTNVHKWYHRIGWEFFVFRDETWPGPYISILIDYTFVQNSNRASEGLENRPKRSDVIYERPLYLRLACPVRIIAPLYTKSIHPASVMQNKSEKSVMHIGNMETVKSHQ